MTKKYALVHKNFSIDNSGEVYFNGKLYTKSGRIGDWVIDNSKLKSVDGTVEISPSKIKLGAFTAYARGRLEGPNWYIDENGEASFEGSTNNFCAQNITMTGTGELRIPAGSKLYIGDGNEASYLHALGDSSGGVFEGDFTIKDDLKIGNNGSITFANSGYGTMWMNSGGIHINSVQGGQSLGFFTDTGSVRCYNLYCLNDIYGNLRSNDVTVDGTALETYIRNVTATMMVEAGVLMSSNTPHNKTVTATDGTNIRPYYSN